jgi:signal transduction histidine kinase
VRAVRPALAAGGVALGVLAYRVQVDNVHSPSQRALATVAVAWAFLASGLVAWTRRPQNRMGLLLTAAGFALLLRQFRYSHGSLPFTLFFAVGDLGYALVGHAALAYPAGKVTGRTERAFVRIGYAAALLLPLAVLLFYDGSKRLLFFDFAPHRSLLLLYGSSATVEVLQKSLTVVFYGVIAALFVVLLVRKFLLATPRLRRKLAPLMIAAAAIALRAIFESVFDFVSVPIATDYLFWWQVGAFLLLPVALTGGLVRARLRQATVGDLVVELEHTPPQGLRDALARALGDATLEAAFWLPERREFVDAGGRRVDVSPGPGRAVTPLEVDEEPLAVLIHDPSLLDEPRLIQAVGATARLALQNARLHAQVNAQLVSVKESRARIVAAADEERRRIERDIHDGAQQRLVALALELRSAQLRLAREVEPELDALLESAVGQLQAAVEELRELARGVHPAILTEEGLGAALESLADRTPLLVSLEESNLGRMPPEVEATAYFVACEAVANTVKHARASSVRMTAARRNGRLVIEVVDDGVGGAWPAGGSGLRGLADRVEALSGRLTIENPASGGTRVLGEIPCGS